VRPVSGAGGAWARLGGLLERQREGLDLAEAALLIAAAEYPGLVVREWLSRLDDVADEARPWIETAAAAGRWSDGLSRYLFGVLGLHGNAERYDDPRNSYLNDVLERRAGLPITLSVLYVAVARRCGRLAEGVGLPGHFIVRAIEADGDILLDPFNGGVRLGVADCGERVAQMYGSALAFRPDVHLRRAEDREILARMLRNLKSTYLRAGDLPRALRTVDGLLTVAPEQLSEARDRGLLRMRGGDLRGALADLDRYLAADPPPADAARLRPLRTQIEAAWERRN
jgi:regulator of sirC expression with transglutaminase-like and TPR domain